MSSCLGQYAQLTKADYYNKIDNKVYTFSKQQGMPFDSVVAFVNRSFASDEDRVRAYYTWIALNISYDMKRAKDMDILKHIIIRNASDISQNADTTFRRRTAVCEGFSKLMVKFCKASSIRAYMVAGYTKTPDGEVVTDILHAWNAVETDGRWGLLDITWSNGYVKYTGQYTKRFSDKYFLSDPKTFVKDHLPLDPMWQMLDEPVSKKEFFEKIDSSTIYTEFHYKDSINTYLQAEPEQQYYLDYLHYHLYDPENTVHAYNLDAIVYNVATDYLDLGSVYFQNFVNFYKATLAKKPTLTNIKKAKTMLEDSRSNIKTAIDYYLKNKQVFTSKNKQALNSMYTSAIVLLIDVERNLNLLTDMQKALLKKNPAK